jgi:hypothetical protein
VFQGADIKSVLLFSSARKATGLNPLPGEIVTEEDIGGELKETEKAELL